MPKKVKGGYKIKGTKSNPTTKNKAYNLMKSIPTNKKK